MELIIAILGVLLIVGFIYFWIQISILKETIKELPRSRFQQWDFVCPKEFNELKTAIGNIETDTFLAIDDIEKQSKEIEKIKEDLIKIVTAYNDSLLPSIEQLQKRLLKENE